MNMMRCMLSLCLLAFSVAVPASAQNVTGTLSTILDEEPSGSGWSAVVSDAQAQCTGNGHPLYHSTVLENQTFEGDYTPTRRMVLAIFSDDGSDVTVDGTKVFPPSGQTAGGQGQGQALDINALHKVGVTLEPNTTHHIKVDYSNIIYTGSGDIDGCTLFAYEKTPPYISLNTAQSPMTATYSSPNGIDPKNVKFIFDGVDQTANANCSASSLSYTLPSGVSFFASHSVEVDVADNDGNLGVAAVSAHTLMPEDPFSDTSTSTTVSYNLAGPQQVRVRVCLYGTDTATKTFAASAQSAGKQSVTWNGLDDNDGLPQTGVYVFKVEEQSGNSWVDIADIDPIRGRTVRLNIDGARLSDENTNSGTTPGGTERTTQYPVKIWGTLTGSWTMVPLQLVGTTLLGTVVINGQYNSTLDGYAYNDPHNTRVGGPPAPDYVPGSSALYWYVKDVAQIRSLAANAAGQTMPYRLSATAALGGENGMPAVTISTGQAAVSQLPAQMSYNGDTGSANSIAYTFDDGPYNSSVPNTSENDVADEATTDELLQLLGPKHGYYINCTFFLNGVKIRATNDVNTYTEQSIQSFKHELANHTYSHYVGINKYYQNHNGQNNTSVIPSYADWIRSELIESRLVMRYVPGGVPDTNFFRPPGGEGVGYLNPDGTPDTGKIPGTSYTNDRYFWQTVGETGYKTIAWHKYPDDNYSKYPSSGAAGMQQQANQIISYLKNSANGGDIVLLHNGREHTVVALQTVLPFLLSDGWQFKTVSQINPVYQP